MFARLLDSAVRNLSNAFYDQYVEVNTKFRAKAGLKQIVIRRQLWHCCDWCSKLAGTYIYGTEPKDVWRRHQNCKCLVTTQTEKGTFQDAWSRKEYDTQRAARIAREKAIIAEQKVKDLPQNRIDMEQFLKYSNSPVDVKGLMKIYDEDVAAGWISPVSGFDNYLEIYLQIENEIVGIETSNGIKVTGQSRHFMQRIIGTGSDPEKKTKRSGVRISDISNTLTNGIPYKIQVNNRGERSQVFIGKRCKVTVNPDTGNLIQCNPRGNK